MDINKIPSSQFGDVIAPWHKWFAWKPVKTWDHRTVWLRNILRRPIQFKSNLDGPCVKGWWWQYHSDHGYAGSNGNGDY
jgi:hypothetical protein